MLDLITTHELVGVYTGIVYRLLSLVAWLGYNLKIEHILSYCSLCTGDMKQDVLYKRFDNSLREREMLKISSVHVPFLHIEAHW